VVRSSCRRHDTADGRTDSMSNGFVKLLKGAIKIGSPIVHHPSYREATKISSVLRSSE
jgi:hypothetical protein